MLLLLSISSSLIIILMLKYLYEEKWYTKKKIDYIEYLKDNLNQDHRSLNTHKHTHLHCNTRTEEFFELNN